MTVLMSSWCVGSWWITRRTNRGDSNDKVDVLTCMWAGASWAELTLEIRTREVFWFFVCLFFVFPYMFVHLYRIIYTERPAIELSSNGSHVWALSLSLPAFILISPSPLTGRKKPLTFFRFKQYHFSFEMGRGGTHFQTFNQFVGFVTKRDRVKFIFSPAIILCGRLGLKYQITHNCRSVHIGKMAGG